MRRLTWVALFTVACGAAAVHAQVLALSYAKGATYHYTFHMTSESSVDTGVMTVPVKLDIKAKETVKVNSVDSSGIADVSVTLTDATLTMATGEGQTKTTTTSTQSTMSPIDVKIATDGRVLSINGTSIPGDLSLGLGAGGSLVSAVLPDGPVKPGDTWTKNYDQPSPYGGGSISVTASSTYLRNEKFHGVDAALVETKSTVSIALSIGATTSDVGPAMKGTQTSDVTSWIDPSGHRLLKSFAKSNIDLSISSLPATGSGTMPGLVGPFGLKGSQTFDLEPA